MIEANSGILVVLEKVFVIFGNVLVVLEGVTPAEAGVQISGRSGFRLEFTPDLIRGRNDGFLQRTESFPDLFRELPSLASSHLG